MGRRAGSSRLAPTTKRLFVPAPKRLFDVIFAGFALVALTPLLLVIAALVKADGGPVLFEHVRVGRGGLLFGCLKFRSMVADSAERLEALLASDPDARAEWEATRKLRRDPRVTAVGRLLRATSLDELPQLINVLRGEMSLVGPRPVQAAELPELFVHAAAAADYLSVRPGITGPWQVSGRSEMEYHERVSLDAAYARNPSLAVDLRILFRWLALRLLPPPASPAGTPYDIRIHTRTSGGTPLRQRITGLLHGVLGGSAHTKGPQRSTHGHRSDEQPPLPREKASNELAECHFHAEMPPQPELGRPAQVRVTVAREQIERLAGPTSQQAQASASPEKEIILQVLPRANCRAVGEDRAVVAVPQAQAPVQRVFEVEGIAAGAAEVWVEVRQGPIPLAVLQLQPVFGLARAAVLSASATAVVGGLQQVEPDHLVLRIYEESLGPDLFRLRFNLDCKAPNINLDVKTREFGFSRERFVADQYAKLERAWIVDGADYDRFMRRLKARGTEIYDDLVPKEVRETLWSHRRQIRAVQVISEEPFIPWEIAYLTDPAAREEDGESFLGALGLVRWLHNIPWPRAELRLRPECVRFAIPDYPHPDWKLPGAAKEAEVLQQLFPGAQPVRARSEEVEDLLQQGGEVFDVLHFACHGLAEGDKIWDAGLMMTGRMVGEEYQPDPLEAAQVYAAARLGSGGVRPLVFLNACQVGRTGRSLRGVGGFAKAFLSPKSRQGAGLFVGTLWSVGDGSALTFARTFYERLQAGETLVAATRLAREQAKAAREPTWLAYTVYGHPQAKIGPDEEARR